MAVAPGTRFGPYEIREVLGAGGMGEVYRALDPRIGREVAVKVLPPAFADNADRLARFEQEARAAGVLNHPGILAVHDVGHEGSVHYLVTELLEGETLRQKLGSPMPQRKIIDYALQISKGLAAAHDKGIIHRDLKPENLFVTNDGRLKILDFGLAKLTQPEMAGEVSKLLTGPETAPGLIMGTLGYMSPEQVRGKSSDHRSDIFAFGVILYEMITGRRAFHGETVADTMSAILGKEPPEISGTNSNLSPAMTRIVEHCMEKKPEQRFQSMHDVAFYLETLSGVSTTSAPTTPLKASRSGVKHWIPWVISLLAITGAVIWMQMQRSSTPGSANTGSRKPQRFAVQLSATQELAIGGNSLLRFSPDGGSLVFSGNVDGRKALFRRDLDKGEAVEIAGTEDGEAVFFSPDGRWLGFAARGQLMKVPIEGGRPIRLGEARGAGGATWLADGTIVHAPIYSDGLFRVAAEGGAAERLTTPDRASGVLGHWWPQELPGGRWIIFTAFRTPVDTSRVGAIDLQTREVRWLVEGGFFGRYVSSGHLVYAKGQRLYALPFDATSVKVTGSAVPVLDDLLVEQTGGCAMFAISNRGTLAYVTESIGRAPNELVWIDRTGRSTPAINERHRFLSTSLSPDGQRAALTLLGVSRDLWIYSFDRGTLSRLTTGDDTEYDPVWSRDGNELFYVVDSPPFELHRINTGSPDSGRPVWKERAQLDTTAPTVSPDGRTLVFALTEEGTGSNLYARPIDGSEPPRPIRASRSEEEYPTFSPDGRWLAYHSDETGRPEIYVESFPVPGERFQISADGGRQPRWARNGELFYRRGNELRVITTRFVGRFEFDAPQTLFTFRLLNYATGGVPVRIFDITPDGKRILAITIPEPFPPRRIDIVPDWTSDLARLVAAK